MEVFHIDHVGKIWIPGVARAPQCRVKPAAEVRVITVAGDDDFYPRAPAVTESADEFAGHAAASAFGK